MKITYLIGNGFDINLGLKTRYVDFLSRYKEIKESDDDCIIDLKKSIQQYYDKETDAMNWSDLELTLGKYTKHLQGIENPDLCMKKCLDNIREKLAQYLIEQENRLLDDIPKQIDGILYFWNDLTDITSGLRPDDKLAVSDFNNKFAGLRTVGFLNFNYTNVLDRMVRWTGKNLNAGYNPIRGIFHVHGTTKHGMAIGVNDESQIAADIFNENEPERKNALIKPLFNEEMGEGTEAIASKRIDESDVIYVYGMSLGETDRRWWEKIVQWMAANTNHTLLIYRHEVPTIGLTADNYELYVRIHRADFVNNYGSQLKKEVKEEIQKRIFFCHTNQFKRFEDCLKE